jgi:hypothetical protein
VARRKVAVGDAGVNSEAPPRWLERTLLLFLPVRHRETISGDLLEEYREEQLPRLGSMRANIWYLRQLVSFGSARIVGGPHVKKVLTLMCLFIVAAGIWLAVMENILKHPDYFERTMVAACIVIQGLATLLFLFINGGAVFRALVITGGVGIALLGASAIARDLRAQHFEGFVLIIGLALVLEGALTLLALLRKDYGKAA